MIPFWNIAVRPVLEASGARFVAEIGALEAGTTRNLVAALRPGAELHVIDPKPQFDPADLARDDARIIFHEDLSLNVLPALPPLDLVLIDGDHNWYTVFNELRELRAVSRAAEAPLPICILHDIGWPYARRDGYHDPETIPPAFRQPYARGGIRRGVSGLVSGGGLNMRMQNAVEEGGPRNGVLTAVEDFLAEHDQPVRMVTLPAYFGLAVLAEEARLATTPQLRDVLDQLEGDETLQQLLTLADDLWLSQITRVQEEVRASPARRNYAKLVGRAVRGELVAPETSEPLTQMDESHVAALMERLDDIRLDDVPGDLLECGAGRGGSAIFLRGYLDAWSLPDRRLWLADSFRAEPGLNGVRDAFARFGLLDDRVRFIEGEAAQALAEPAIGPLALIHVSDIDAAPPDVVLERIYDRLAVGGFVVFEDGGLMERRQAIDAARRRLGIDEPIAASDHGYAWRKRKERAAPPPASTRPPVPLAPAVPPGARQLDLSIVVVSFNIRREAERSLRSLSRAYQRDVADIDYEIVVVENGSNPDQALGADYVRSFGDEFVYLAIPEPSPSPAPALNRGIAASTGSTVALMIDGAHILSPGVVATAMRASNAFPSAVVATPYWFLGPDHHQYEAIAAGYTQESEDELLRRIDWPKNGYALFDIAHPLAGMDWFDSFWESCCLFAPRALLEQYGGVHEAFQIPGGSLANLEVLERLAKAPGVNLVTLLGEASFHQTHGGSTTGIVDSTQRRAKIRTYFREYEVVKGRSYTGLRAHTINYVGSLAPNSRRTRARRWAAPHFGPTTHEPDGFPIAPTPLPAELRDAYTEAFWYALDWNKTRWLGHHVGRSPADMHAYQELLASLRPTNVVVVHSGNLALPSYLASVCDALGVGTVIAVGPQADTPSSGGRLVCIEGDPEDPRTVASTAATVDHAGATVIFLATRASTEVAVRQFDVYAPLVPVGSYVVIEDTILNGRPVWPGFGYGPGEAIDTILRRDETFSPDQSLERFGPTFNRRGYLRRVASDVSEAS